MAVFKINKTKDYTVMSNHHLKETEMSLKAKGLLSVMLSLPETWDYSISGLVAICKENESAINSTLKELKDFGYLRVDKFMPNQTKSGRIEYVYNIYEIPQQNQCTEKQEQEKQGLENQCLEIQGVENQGVENQGQYNINNKSTNKLNNNKLNTNKDKENSNINITTKEKQKSTRFIPPTEQEVYDYANSRGRGDLAKKFYDYYTATEWCDSKGNKVKRWKGKFITWESNNPIKAQNKINNKSAVNREWLNKYMEE